MTEKEQSILKAFLSKTLTLDGEAISGLFNSDGELVDLKIAEDAHAEKVQKYKTEKQNEFNRGIEKGASKIEKAIKEKYQVETDLIGVDLLDHVIELQTSELNEKLKSKSKDDDFEKSPKYLQLKKDHEAQLKAKEQEWLSKLTEKESEWTKKETLSKIAKLAFNRLESEFILPENPERAAALKEVLQKELEAGNYKFDESGEVVLIDNEGKPIEDKYGKFPSFNDYVDSLSGKFFDKRVANVRENAANKNQQQQQPIGAFKSQDEYLDAVKNAKSDQEKVEVLKRYQSSNM